MDFGQSENDYYLSNEFIKAIFKAIPTHVYFKDLDFRYRLLSEMSRQFNIEVTGQDILGKADFEVYQDKDFANALRQDDIKIIESKKGIHYISQVNYNDEVFHYDVYKEPVFNDKGEVLGIIGVLNDITEIKNLEIKQRSLNRVDALTGLFNRNYYEERIQSILTESNLPLTIIIGDTNQLKYVNDNYGHTVGDDLLKTTAGILRESVTDFGEIFRIGGDEFVILCPRTDEKRCLQIMKHIRQLESEKADLAIPIKTSLGYAIADSVSDKILEKINAAEKNMYDDKRKQKT